MQVNSAQDYLTRYKQRIIARTYVQDPPSPKNRVPSNYTMVVANKARQRERFIVPLQRGISTAAPLYSSFCCVSGTRGRIPGSIV